MNSINANKLSIVGFLMSNGINPVGISGNHFIFDSPLHTSRGSKLKVHRINNEWFDFTTGISGRLLELICKMYNVDSAGALLVLSGRATIKTDSGASPRCRQQVSFALPKI